MADESDDDGRRLDPEAAAAPNRDRRGGPPIIDGEVTGTEETASSPARDGADEPSAPKEATRPDESELFSPPPAPPPARSFQTAPLAAAAVGAAVGALIVAGVLWLERPETDSALPDRVAALDKSVGDLGRRVSELEAGLHSAKGTLDAAKADSVSARADAAKALDLVTKSAAAAGAAAPSSSSTTTDTSALSARLDKLEGGLAAGGGASGDLGPLETRVGKLEAALQAPKSETRAAPDAGAEKSKDWTALAIAAEATSMRVASGLPYAPALSGLERLGVDASKIAALKPFAERGAPTSVTLQAGFEKIAPEVLRAAAQKSSGGVMDRLMANMGKVVKITPVGETAGDDPPALVSQIEGALSRGDIGAAMAAWVRLPEPARQVSQDWANSAEARLAAEAAAQAILNEAMTKMAAGDKP
jgi:hypothetical protein